MNNNNRNNRRRGRGNRNQSGNGSQLNRIDSRARGNAPQMLDKYKKLAQDAHHNGDRVQMEYYLQFADHYFRVIADNKARIDEQRGGPRRSDDRDQAEEYGEDDLDFASGRRSEPSSRRYERQDRDSRGDMAEGEPGQEGESFMNDDRGSNRDDERGDDRSRDRGSDRSPERSDAQPRGQNPRRQPRKPREDNRAERSDRAPAPRAERAPRPDRTEPAERAPRKERAAAADSETPAETPAEKPAPRTRKPRKTADAEHAGIDSSILPPSIRSSSSDTRSKGGDSSGDSDGALETVG